jgi:hypothetical protein
MPISSLPIVDQDFEALEPSPYNRGRWWLPREDRELTCGTRIIVHLGDAVVPASVEYDHTLDRYVALTAGATIVLRAGLSVGLHHERGGPSDDAD